MFGKKVMKKILILTISAIAVLSTAALGLAATHTINCISAWPKTAFETSNPRFIG
jgi:hypothetical protein